MCSVATKHPVIDCLRSGGKHPAILHLKGRYILLAAANDDSCHKDVKNREFHKTRPAKNKKAVQQRVAPAYKN